MRRLRQLESKRNLTTIPVATVLSEASICTSGAMDGDMPIPREARPALRELPEELAEAGFLIRNDFVSAEEEAMLLREIDSRQWETQLSRRTQHYGWRFEYTSKSCVPISESIPAVFIEKVLKRLGTVPNMEIPWLRNALEVSSVQCTVNEYERGQGIAPHVDTHAAFDDGIIALSLGSGIGLRLKQAKTSGDDRDYNLWLERRSLITYVDAARYAFMHGIVSRKGDLIDGKWMLRNRRVSITFRRLRRRLPCSACSFCDPLSGCGCACHSCRCRYPQSCDARPGGAPKMLPTRIRAAVARKNVEMPGNALATLKEPGTRAFRYVLD